MHRLNIQIKEIIIVSLWPLIGFSEFVPHQSIQNMHFFASCLAHQKWPTLFLCTNATSLLTKDTLCFYKGLEKSLYPVGRFAHVFAGKF